MPETKTKKQESKKQPKASDFGLELKEMAMAGLHFGHRASKLHPKMKPYIYGIKKTVHLIELEKTKQKFIDALRFIKDLISDGKIILLVGTKPEHKKAVQEVAKECNLPYVTGRWLGGTLTNFSVTKKRIGYLKELEGKKNSQDFEKYTKKERMGMEQEIQDLNRKFNGVRNLEGLPDAVFVCDLKKDGLAAKEARMKGIKGIGICDTNVNPEDLDYPIPANDDAISSVRYILEKVREAILKSQPKDKKTD